MRELLDSDPAVVVNRLIDQADLLLRKVPPFWRNLFLAWVIYAALVCWFSDRLTRMRLIGPVDLGTGLAIIGAATLLVAVIAHVNGRD